MFSKYSQTHLLAFAINETELVHSSTRLVTSRKKKIRNTTIFFRVYSNALHILIQVHQGYRVSYQRPTYTLLYPPDYDPDASYPPY